VSTGNLVSYLVSCGGFRSDASSLAVDSCLVQEGFLLGHEPCGSLRSSLKLVIGTIGFWQDPIDSLSYPVLL
jgi:hypothetical protein